MKKLIPLALVLSACTPVLVPAVPVVGTPTPIATCVGGGVAANVLMDEKALFAAESLYNVPAHAYVTLNDAGKLTVNQRNVIRPLLIKAFNTLTVLRTAYRVGDTSNFQCQYNNLVNLNTQVRSLLPRG